MLKLLADLIRVVNRAAPAYGEAPTSFKAVSRFGISNYVLDKVAGISSRKHVGKYASLIKKTGERMHSTTRRLLGFV
jgi:hypothetical protein